MLVGWGCTERVGARSSEQSSNEEPHADNGPGHWRALRGRFLNALWDAEAAGASFPRVSVLLETTGDRDLPHDDVERLVRTLHSDGLIDGISFAEGEAQQIRLTSGGRAEVEQWLAEPTRPTEHLPLPANQVFNIDSMHVTGTVVQGSAANMIVTNVGVTGEALQKLVAEFRELLSSVELSQDEREELEADLGVVEDEAAAPQPRPQRLRPAFRRLSVALTTGVLAGVEVTAKEEVTQLLDAAQRMLPG